MKEHGVNKRVIKETKSPCVTIDDSAALEGIYADKARTAEVCTRRKLVT